MITNHIFAALALSAMVGAPVAAQDGGAWYVTGQYGVRAVDDATLSGGGVEMSTEQHNGGFAALALGRTFDRGGVTPRFELEVARFGGGDLRQFSVNGAPAAATGDGIASTALMANVLLDLSDAGRVTPFIGAGLGFASVSADIRDGAGNSIDDSETKLAFQGLVGVDVALTDSWSLIADLRYFRTGDAEFELTGTAGSGVVSAENDVFALGAGFRLSF